VNGGVSTIISAARQSGGGGGGGGSAMQDSASGGDLLSLIGRRGATGTVCAATFSVSASLSAYLTTLPLNILDLSVT